MTAFEKLRKGVFSCTRCKLRSKCNAPLPPEGCLSDSIMVISRNPNTFEDVNRVVFSGNSGDLLTKVWAEAGIDRNAIYMTYLVKCSTKASEEPDYRAVESCAYWLNREMQNVHPRLIVTLGALAAERVTGIQFEPNRVITTDHSFGPLRRGVLVATLMHPGYIYRIAADKTAEYVESWQKIKKIWDAIQKQDPEKISATPFIG